MHIVLANQWFPPESGWGGVAMWNYALARALVALGHTVTVLTAQSNPSSPRCEDRHGISIRRLPTRQVYRWQRLPGVGYYARELFQLEYARRVAQALRVLYRAHPFDVVEFAEVNAEGYFYARQPLTPLVVRCHTPTFVLQKHYASAEMPFDTRLTAHSEKYLIRHAHALTAPSQDMANVIAQACGFPSQRITVIPNALEWKEFQTDVRERSAKELVVLHVGRLERVKGVVILAQAIPQILAQIPEIRFVFVGADFRTARGVYQRGELEEYFAAKGVSDRVEFTGKVEQHTLLEWYKRADICVVPTLNYESFSYTCAQAMAAGKPIIATRIGGISETVDDGQNGLLVEPGNATELANALVVLARDPERRAEMGRAGRAKVACEFDPRRVAGRNLQVYETARARFKSAAP